MLDSRQHDAPSLGELLQSAVEIPIYRLVDEEKDKKDSRLKRSAGSESEEELSDAAVQRLHRKAEMKERATLRAVMKARRKQH